VLDDNLRPAFQSLLTATSSITLSQEALNVALDTSAATGKSLGQVTDAIVKSYNGQSKGLRTLGVALSKTALKTGNTELALKELQKAYSGQAAARLGTYAGKMDLLRVAAADATEIIGKGLVDALTKLGKDDSIQNAADSMNSFALAIADTVRGLGTLVGEVKKFAGTDIGKLLSGLAFLVFGSKKLLIGGALALIANDIGRSNPSAQPNVGGYSGIPSVQERIRKQEFDSRKKLIAALKAEEALKNLKDKYDVERIGLMAALNAATDEETKVRLAEKLAILDGNAAMAEKYKLQNIENEAIKTVTARPVPGSGLARIQRDLASLPSNRVTAPAYKVTSMKVTKAAKDAAASDARSVVMRDRVKGLARKAELGAIRDKKAATDAGLGTDATTMRTRVMKLARQAELDKKAAMDKAKVKGSSSVGYRDAPLPGSAAAIPRGGNVPTVGPIGKQASTPSDFYKRRRRK
jgi:hypothetical protein